MIRGKSSIQMLLVLGWAALCLVLPGGAGECWAAKDTKDTTPKETKSKKPKKKTKKSKKPKRGISLPGRPYPREGWSKDAKTTQGRDVPGGRYAPLSQSSPGEPSGQLPGRAVQPGDLKRPKPRRGTPIVRRRTKAPPKRSSGNVFVLGSGDRLTDSSKRVLQARDRDADEIENIRKQLKADPMPIPPRLGGVFVPNISRRYNVRATSYVIIDKTGKQVAIARTGKKAFVFPGWYTIRIGSYATDVLPKYKVQIQAGKMTIIRPRWAALIIRVVDERLIQFRGTYDLIHLDSRRGVGTGIGADDSLGEKVRPWLLQPGTYMIVRTGDNYLARTNYFTVRVEQGKVTTFRLVVSRTEGTFLGGGVIIHNKAALGTNRASNWSWSLQLNINVLWNQVENVQGSASGHSFNLTSLIFGRLAYSGKRHFFQTTLNTELGFTVPASGEFQKSADRLELQSIYIFRVVPFFGPYVRAGVEVTMFPNVFTFGPDDLRLLEPGSVFLCNDQSCSILRQEAAGKLKNVNLSGAFDPFLLRQGLGINLQAVRRSFLDLRILFGLGFRQDIAREVYQFNANVDIGSTRCSDPTKRNPTNPLDLSGCSRAEDQENHTTVRLFERVTTNREGVELAIVATGRISRFMSFATELDALVQFDFDRFRLDIDWRSTVTLRLSHYAAIIYRLRLRRDSRLAITPNIPELSLWSVDQSVLLSFSLLL